MTGDERDPFEALALPVEPRRPRPRFVAELRARLVTALEAEPDTEELGADDDLDLSAIPTLPRPRRAAMPSSTSPSTTTPSPAGRAGPLGGEPGIWAGLSYRDAPAGIAFLTDVLGFEVQTLATDPADATTVVHSELRWPEGGVVQAGTYVADNEFMQAPGAQAIYVITRDPQAVWDRCRAAGAEVVRPPEEPHYHPGGMVFAIRDPEGNILSFGDYAGGA